MMIKMVRKVTKKVIKVEMIRELMAVTTVALKSNNKKKLKYEKNICLDAVVVSDDNSISTEDDH